MIRLQAQWQVMQIFLPHHLSVAYVDRKKPMLQIDKVQIPPECCKRGKGMPTPTEEVEVPPTAPERLGESPPSTSQEHAPERRTLHGMYFSSSYKLRLLGREKLRFLYCLSFS
ncbi:hypothetical protein NPIL_532301 [Nephila pilipes]|uniref:Uncharacterized protein n=1 Tax=Nephila pilipes TaxID=299642 RepID=A0A8X6QHI5_NEPPI|nr:hypothetical protein NPIL_532301 [Nephila pilipes]